MKSDSHAVTADQTPRKDLRGRRPTFRAGERARLANLIREHGIRGTQRVAGVAISINTLVKIGREFHIQLPRGRGRRNAA